jgi:sialate O-acetylesterase
LFLNFNHNILKMNKALIILVTGLFLAPVAQARIGLPSIFSDGMVLQQNSDVTIWGWGIADETIRIIPEWMPGDTVKAHVDNIGKWSATIRTIHAGGPYTIELIGSTTLKLNDVMLGEVWLCSGQSNMEWDVNGGILNGEEEVANASYPLLRIFKLPKRGSDFPQEYCEGTWVASTPETMRNTSAVGYFYGRMLSERLQVPVGIIVAAWGGTPAESWTPADVYHSDSRLHNPTLNPSPWWPVKAGVLYNTMIYPVAPYGIAGCIWYQGESNHENAHTYAMLMEKMIGNWREIFRKDFPFYLVQIAPYMYWSERNTPAQLREQQELITRRVPNTAMIVVSDLVENVADVHPHDKKSVGHRLAYLALAQCYQQKESGAYRSPLFDRMDVVKDKAIISFRELDGNTLKCKGKEVTGLQICGDNGVFVTANAQLKGSQRTVWSPEVKQPKAVRYCFDDATIGNLFSEKDIPVAPFRTDRDF